MEPTIKPEIALLAVVLVTCLALLAPMARAQQDRRECDLTLTGHRPLPDAGGLWYRRVGLTPEYATAPSGSDWRVVGLYGNGLSSRPHGHEQAGLAVANQIEPIDGKIVMLSIGMSNTSQEFGRFENRAENDPIVNPALEIVNAALGGRPADVWTSPIDETWDLVDQRLAQNGLTADQVQIAWIKHAVRSPQFPPLDFPQHPETLQGILEDVVRSMKVRYPNVKLAYVSSRTRAYNSDQGAQSPEPAAYENGFAVQWMIESQIHGAADLRFDGVNPPAPWLSWGPYLWIDGMGAPQNDPPQPFEARSDGAVWTCSDVQSDGVHPSPPTPGEGDPAGEFKVGDQLMAFFKTDATTTPWFLSSTTGGPVLSALTANGQDMLGGGRIVGSSPLTVSMSAVATGSVAEYSWTFDDGTFSYNANGTSAGQPRFDDLATPTKVFKSPGSYDVRLTVGDADGDATLAEFQVIVDGVGLCAGALELFLSRAPDPSFAELRWCLEPSAESYNVYRGTRADRGDLSCFLHGVRDASTLDDGAVAPGNLFVVLVSSISGGVESGLGMATGGERPNTLPCP